MKYYRKQNKTTESICIDKITKGINSIKKGVRTGQSVGKDLEFFFNKLEDCNKGMYEGSSHDATCRTVGFLTCAGGGCAKDKSRPGERTPRMGTKKMPSFHDSYTPGGIDGWEISGAP